MSEKEVDAVIPHFSLYAKRKEYLLIRMGDAFHIIDCNDAMTEDVRGAVLESGCTSAEMQEMGLSGMTIAKSDIQSVAIAGSDFMDEVVIYLKRKRLAYRFFGRYDMDDVDTFFQDVPRRGYEQRQTEIPDWRSGEQDAGLYQKLRPLGWVWNGVCIAVTAWPLIWNPTMEALGWVATALGITALLLASLYPDYFSIFLRLKKRLRAEGPVIDLGGGLLIAEYVFLACCQARYHVFSKLEVLMPALVLTLLIGGALYLCCREFTMEPVKGAATMIVVFVLSFYAFIPHFNHVLKPELEPQTGVIVDKYQRISRYLDRYFCLVQLPDGREVEVAVSVTLLERSEIGDTMELEVGTGIFGIDYAWMDEREMGGDA